MSHDATCKMLEGLPEPFRTAGLARVDDNDRRHQDKADGAALRRLREALPGNTGRDVWSHRGTIIQPSLVGR